MTTPDDSEGDLARDELLAGEYVLGVLSLRDRAEVERRLERDPAFAGMVARWQNNLADLNQDYVPVAPPPDLFKNIEARLFAPASAEPSGWLGRLWNSAFVWRLVSLAMLVLLVSYGLFTTSLLMPDQAGPPLVAELSAEGAPVTLFARYDARSGRLQMTPVATDAPSQEHSLELWLVPGNNAPTISLGVLPQTGDGAIEIPLNLRSRLTEGATLAVSLEPLGGSPTGQATGPVIAVGQTRRP